MSSDGIEDDFDPPPLPSKRRKLNPRTIRESDDDSVTSGSVQSRISKKTNRRRKSGTADDTETPEPRQKKAPKPKHLIHVHTNPIDFEDQLVTQASDGDPPSSAPWMLRGARWQKPLPRPTSPPRSPIQLSRDVSLFEQKSHNQFLPTHPAPAAQVTTPGHGVSTTSFANGRIATATDTQALSMPPPIPSESAFNIAQELADLPSDAFESSEEDSPQRAPTRNYDVIELSSQVELSPPQPRNLAAPKVGLQQMTLFGTTAQGGEAAAQTAKKHNWPLASREEPPSHHKLDLDAMRTYIYPKNLGTRRDYQFSIVRRGLFHNLLVALPTGLGKTFIAATIMLNWFRWTVDAQIVFVAPTKPLVSQQVEACFGVAGIPKSQTSMLTGGVSPGWRAEEWRTKRVFFTTPQTFSNDLKTGIADPKRIVLLVVDEAHRATGNYSYVDLVTFLRRFNQSFRLLALTATPGASIEAVQEVINGLKISRIEIRTEFSIDIRQYIYTKDTESFVFDNSADMEFVMDLFSKALSPLLQKLRSQQAYWIADPMQLSNYGLMQGRKRWMETAGKNANMGVKAMINRLFTVLASVAHNIELLKYHGISPFYHNMVIFRNSNSGGHAGKYEKEILESEHFTKMMTHIGMWIRDDNFVCHPKLEHLQQVVLNHFLDAGDGGPTGNGQPPSATRIMIFASYRDSAEEICRVLKRNSPMIRPHVFVGQQASKGSEGMNQKQQLGVIEDFKKGVYNTLIATSIGEEGLDIGEIDLIICYDSSSSPIRMLQRIGRTGRKRAGKVCLLLMRGKEEQSIVKAKDNYEKIQKLIAEGTQFNFHEDSARRIVPKDIDPIADEIVVEIPIENTQAGAEPKRKGRPPKRPPKKFHMPDGVRTGFTTASRMDGEDSENESGPAKRKRTARPKKPMEALEELVPLADVFLTSAQEVELAERYQNLPDDDEFDYVIARPSNTKHPDRQRRLAPTCFLKHSTATKGMVSALDAMSRTNMHRIGVFQRHSRTNIDDLLESPAVLESDSIPSKPKTTTAPAKLRKLAIPKAKPAAATTKPAATKTPKAAARAVPKPRQPAQSRVTKAKPAFKPSRPRYDEASEGESESSADEPSQSMAFATQGIDLGSDTSGSDGDEGEPSSQLRAFIANDDDEIEELSDDALPSSPPVARSRGFEKEAEIEVDSESDDEDPPSLEAVLQKRRERVGQQVGKRTADSPVGGRVKKARRVVEDSSD